MTKNLVRSGALLFCLSACASSAFQARPEDVPRLEQRVAQSPNDRAVAVQLGASYVAAKRYEDARRVLQPIVAANSTNGAAFLYLGIASEELSDFAGARSAYQKYLETGRDQPLKEDIRARLGLLARREMKQQAQAALRREQVVSDEPPTPRTIAVLPFAFNAPNDELKPLQTALADMMITDLSVSPAIVPVERVRLQALLDEMLLGQAALSDGAATIRAGRLLKAENLVQGAITIVNDREVRVDGAVLLTAQQSARGQLTGQNTVDAIFDLEKQLVFRIYELLGVTLTPAERERINENRSANLIAFLNYGRGLEALDRGSYTEATSHFNQATRIDPSFSRALEQHRQATQLRQAGATPVAEIVVSAVRETRSVVGSVAPIATSNTLLTQLTNDVNYSPGQNLTQQGNTGEGSATGGQKRNNGGQEAQGGGSGGLQGALKAILTITIPRPGS
jgi:tetratricopeptide (TPR) repeat protein